ncbi:TPA: hypothetical protein HA242_03880 [Candidatus Woesearchaeota archaeon]|nr:hypothetical protein [Candidatus Woesearchaeota archaeon]HIH12836.1 hypothetical protein [Candidatus Woesearchaeota archaeon]
MNINTFDLLMVITMVYYSSAAGNIGYSTTTPANYSSGAKIYSTPTVYTMKKNPVCCGSFSRGQRCVGCPGR